MKRFILAVAALAMLAVCTAPVEAGRYWRVRRPYYSPVVVRPYVAPVYIARPVYVAPPPIVVARPVIYHAPVYHPPVYHQHYGPSVQVRSSYYGGGVRVSTPGFGLHISY